MVLFVQNSYYGFPSRLKLWRNINTSGLTQGCKNTGVQTATLELGQTAFDNGLVIQPIGNGLLSTAELKLVYQSHIMDLCRLILR